MHTIKITLDRSQPEIWRRIIVPGSCSLLKFNHMIQAAMGWTNSHLAEFTIAKARYRTKEFDDDYGDDILDWTKYTVENLLKEGSDFIFVYDLGDEWTHLGKVEKVDKIKGTLKKSACLDGARACPPEDCGSIWGYEDMLQVLASPSGPDYEELYEWLEGDFDPEEFEAQTKTKEMQSALWQKMER